MQELDKRFDFPEPIKHVSMKSINDYCDKFNNMFKSPFQWPDQLTETAKFSLENRTITFEVYVKLKKQVFPFSNKILNKVEKVAMLKTLSDNLELIVSPLKKILPDTKMHMNLMIGVIKLLFFITEHYEEKNPQLLEFNVSHNNSDIGNVIFQMMLCLLNNQDVIILCSNQDLFLSLHVVNSLISNVANEKLKIIFVKYETTENLSERSSTTVVFSDADTLSATQNLIESNIYFAGKTLMRSNIVFVQQNIYSQFKEDLKNLLTEDLLQNSLCNTDITFLQKFSCSILKENFNFFEAPASVIDHLNYTKWQDFTLIVPFKTVKDYLTMIKAYIQKQTLVSDVSACWKFQNYSLNIFSQNSNSLWQIIPLIEGFHSIFINCDFLPAYNSSLFRFFEKTQNLLPLNSGAIPIKIEENPAILSIMNALNHELKTWSSLKLNDRMFKIKEAYPNVKLNLRSIPADVLSFDLDSKDNQHKNVSSLNLLLNIKCYKSPFGLVCLILDDYHDIESHLAHCLLAGNCVLIYKEGKKDIKISESLKSLVKIIDQPPICLYKYGVLISRPLTIDAFLDLYFLQNQVSTPIGKELFSN